VLAPALVVTIVATSISWAALGGASALGVLVAFVVITAVVGLALRRRVRSWGYLERDEDLIVTRGLMFRKLTVVPYGRMQFIDVTAGPVERFFGLASIQLHTAAAATDARIPGLENSEAERLRDRLARLGEAHSSGL
jgi:membrane protein YdbS with pleckstrin-like domain